MTHIWEQAGLSLDEYCRIRELMGREPNPLELGMLGVMWSEHCSYKSSRHLLGELPSSGPGVLQGPGGNAGVVDIGHGWALAFKIESHNHPSAIEPYQGAATGVGGIVRDILAMGARPLALLDSLRFAPPDTPAARALMRGVVEGIAGYGNAIGVPTVGGELQFDPAYAGNPLVNVMCVGLVAIGGMVASSTGPAGNLVVLAGNPTGRDGIHGATFASEELREGGEDRRPSVQVGDPFRGKLLIESCLEVLERGTAVGIQDLGAAGLTSAAAEMAFSAGMGMRLDVAAVPRRETGMTPVEVMLSESQERMLLVVEPGRWPEVREVFARWELTATVVGEVTGDGLLQVRDGECQVACLRLEHLVQGAGTCPGEEREAVTAPTRATEAVGNSERAGSDLQTLLAAPGLASAQWVYHQYDHMVQTNTVIGPGADAAVLRVKGTPLGVALVTDGPTRVGQLDAEMAGAHSVAEAARNLVAVGARPLALTNCLNYGNPEKPEVYTQLYRGIQGIARAARALEVPVVSGNVSLYNETGGRAIPPTPVVGMVGIMQDVSRALSPGWRRPGDLVVLLGENQPGLGASAWLWHCRGLLGSRLPVLDLEQERAVQEVALEAHDRGWLESAHDVSQGGLAVALVQCCLATPEGLGVRARLSGPGRWMETWFGEAPARLVVSVDPKHRNALEQLAAERGVALAVLGRVEAGPVTLTTAGESGAHLAMAVPELMRFWKGEDGDEG